MSFVQMVENRLKVKYGTKIPVLSSQMLATCNYMNEGCDGGFSINNGYFAENAYMVTDECAPYKASTKGDSCSNYKKCKPHSRIGSSYFIGKGYGDSSEKKMMKDLMRNGMINIEINYPEVMDNYKTGIVHSEGLTKLHKKMVQLSQQKAEADAKNGHEVKADSSAEADIEKHHHDHHSKRARSRSHS
jgi:hypothetical protein